MDFAGQFKSDFRAQIATFETAFVGNLLNRFAIKMRCRDDVNPRLF
jgi:hypothetical protein